MRWPRCSSWRRRCRRAATGEQRIGLPGGGALAAYCGLRAGEIAQLTREQVREEGESPMLVIIGKGNKQRAVPAPRRVLDELHRYGMPSHGPLFPWRDGRIGPVRSHAVSRLCNDHLHSLGIPESLHKLRHYYGTAMYAASKDVIMVQRMMGHSSVMTTSGYVAYDQQAAHTAAEAVSSRTEEPRPPRLRLVAEAPSLPEVPRDLGGITGRGELSARELEVLHLVADGATNRAVGDSLGVSEDTVKSHLLRISARLGANGRAGLVAAAMRAGLVA